MFRKLSLNLLSHHGKGRGADFVNVLPPDRFRRVIERERSRSDRNSHGFSLVVFDADISNGTRKRTVELTKILESRIRLTDVLGWVGASEMGALLPDTHPDGARKFSDYVRCIMMDRCGQAPECRVYGYPENLKPDNTTDNTDDRQMWLKGLDVGATRGATMPMLLSELRSDEQASRAERHEEAPASPEWNMQVADGVIDEAIKHPPLTLKRLADLIGAVAALIIVSPLMLLTALLIKIVSPGPVLFKQERVGYLGRTFTCLKFRTMHVDADTAGHRNYFSDLMKSATPMRKLDSSRDPRLIPFARTIRHLAIDELPQLINVIRGDMSLIGPRPCIPYEYEEYSRWHRQRVHSLPGMTGLWQVSGKNRTTFAEMMRLDISYARKRNVFFDLAIVLKTVPAIAVQVLDGFSERLRS